MGTHWGREAGYRLQGEVKGGPSPLRFGIGMWACYLDCFGNHQSTSQEREREREESGVCK